MFVIGPADYRTMPWKNGGGSTTEIAIHPKGAALGDFDWRVSMATVREPGPFSLFPGIDRTLAILDGEGIRLDIGGRSETLVRASAPLSFRADVPVLGVPLDGPITDLNVMTRRGRWRHDLRHLVARDMAQVKCRGATILILAVARVRIRVAGPLIDLPAGATVRIDGAAGDLDLAGDSAVDVYLIELFPA